MIGPYGDTALPVLDALAASLLAAAAAVRAREQGAHMTGAAVLGCLCGLLGPLLREAFVHGPSGTAWVAESIPGAALAGSVTGCILLVLLTQRRGRLFPWLDRCSIGLASCLGGIMALSEMGLVGALAIGLINGLAPGLVRDIALGDVALLVESDWYATAAALGLIVSMAALTLLATAFFASWLAIYADESSVIIGCAVTIALMAWNHREPI